MLRKARERVIEKFGEGGKKGLAEKDINSSCLGGESTLKRG